MYLLTAMSLQQIADKIKVPYTTLVSWHQKHKWVQKRKQHEHELQEQTSSQLTKLVRENKHGVAIRHLKMSERIDNGIIAKFDNPDYDPSTTELMELAKASQASAKVSSNVVGLNGAGRNQHQAPANIMINFGNRPEPDSFDAIQDIKPFEIIDDTDPF